MFHDLYWRRTARKVSCETAPYIRRTEFHLPISRMRAASRLWCEFVRTSLPASRRLLSLRSSVHLAAVSSALPNHFQSSLHCLCTGPPAPHVTKQHTATDASPPSSEVTADPTAPDCTGDVTPLARQLSARIRATGPMTVAEYMSEVLTHPLQGYYNRAPGIGEGGDFVTAPELSGMYGEMVGVWLVHEWMKLGAPQPLQLVELGPGRGSLASDILQVVDRLAPGIDLSLHLVERLLTTCSEEQAEQLRAAFQLLTADMGQRFKVWAMLPATCEAILKQCPPAGFTADGTEDAAER